MPRFKVLILPHRFPPLDIEREIISKAGGLLVDGDLLPDEASTLREAQGADAIVTRWTKITPELIARFRRCRLIIRYGIGYDNVAYDAATAAGIIIGHCPSYGVDEVSTHTLALLLACVRDIVGTQTRVAKGDWNDTPPTRQWRMAGRTMGLVGLGNIGRAVARKLGGWGIRLLATDPYVPPELATELNVQLVDLPTLCREADYISLHAPLLPETHHLISQKEFALMKPGVILINTSRGPVLNETALVDSLNRGLIGAAGLDVFEREPLPADSPLFRHPRIVVSDHAAWYSEDSAAELKRTVAEEVVRACTGRVPLAIANPEVLEKLGRVGEWTPSYNAVWRSRRAAIRATR
jgi:D-3-phosphoglycerate dehydrogenase